jgi:hypothetical protein
MIAGYGGRYISKAGSHQFPETRTGSRSGSLSSSFQIWSASKPGTHQPNISH